MGNKKTINCTVLMAGAYPFQKGKRITVQKKDDLFYVSSEGVDFGLVKEIYGAEKDQMPDIPDVFDGIVVENCCEQHLLTMCVVLQEKGKGRRKWRKGMKHAVLSQGTPTAVSVNTCCVNCRKEI